MYREWRSYLNTGNHPAYPSGSACFCKPIGDLAFEFVDRHIRPQAPSSR